MISRSPEAFGEFYRRHEEAILVYLLRRTPNAEVAADLTAEVFAAALIGAPAFNDRDRPAVPWLFTIAKNKLTDSYRRAQVENTARRELGTPPLQLTDDLLDHLEHLNTSTAGQDALDRLQHLPDDQRDAIRAHVLDDRSYLDIATELGTSPSVVRQRVSRGLSSLRNQIRRS